MLYKNNNRASPFSSPRVSKGEATGYQHAFNTRKEIYRHGAVGFSVPLTNFYPEE